MEVGFWASSVDDRSGLPLPQSLVEASWLASLPQNDRERLQWYLTSGAFVESHELAFSFCRFQCDLAVENPKVMGACTLTDGTFCWPEGFWHYVKHHGVKPPAEFLEHVWRNFEKLEEERRAVSGGDDDGEELLHWDEAEQKPGKMPSGMQQWIRQHTTLGGDASA